MEGYRSCTAGTRVSHDPRPSVTTWTDTRSQEQDFGFLLQVQQTLRISFVAGFSLNLCSSLPIPPIFASNERVTHVLERILNKTPVVERCLDGLRETMRSFPSWDLNLGSQEYKMGLISTWPPCLVRWSICYTLQTKTLCRSLVFPSYVRTYTFGNLRHIEAMFWEV